VRIQADHLSFGAIARHWSREPGALPAEEILQSLVGSFWAGEFGELGVCREVPPPRGRRTLGGAIVDRNDIRVPNPPKEIVDPKETATAMAMTGLLPDSVIIGDLDNGGYVSYPALAATPLDQYPPAALDAYLRTLTVARVAFKEWCRQKGHRPPDFWRSNPASKAQSRSRHSTDQRRLETFEEVERIKRARECTIAVAADLYARETKRTPAAIKREYQRGRKVSAKRQE
jgi:hypothetical protein